MVEAFEKAHGRAKNLGFLTPFPCPQQSSLPRNGSLELKPFQEGSAIIGHLQGW